MIQSRTWRTSRKEGKETRRETEQIFLARGTIVQQFSTLAISDVYAVIGYYLHHRKEIEVYLDQREELARQVPQRIEASK